MSIHPPKQLSTVAGLGLNTQRTIEFLQDDVALTTEIWGRLETPWQESGVVIANEGYIWKTEWHAGRQYLMTRFFDETGKLVGTYYDITTPIRRINDAFECEDLYLDVWQPAGGEPKLLDENELKEAVTDKHMTEQEAAKVANMARNIVSLLRAGTALSVY